MKTIGKYALLIVSLTVALLGVFPVLAQTTGEVELVGTVEAMTLDTVTINGQVIAVTAAEINTPLEIDAIVKIEGTLNPDGTIVAREVNPVGAGIQPGEGELIGILESFSGTTIVVNGQTIEVSGAEIEAGLVVGELVKIHATATESNIWMAREVESFVLDESEPAEDANNVPGADEFEITGTLEAIGDDFIVLSGQTITVTGAEIKDTLVVGVLVKVHVSLTNGSLVAREVENALEDDDNANMNTNGNQNANNSDETTVTAQNAIDRVIEVYPNTTVIEIELEDKFGGILVWDIKTSHGIELTIDAETGAILTIERDGDNSNGNANLNSNDNDDDDDNGNINSNGNDNNDDNSGMGSDNDNNDDDDNSGMGSDDDGDDDDDDDDDDNSGMG